MPQCLQLLHTFKQNITGGAFEALAAGTGDNLNIPNFQQGSHGNLLEVWGGNSANACDFDVRSPFFHDNIRGLRMAQMFNPTLSGADGDPQLLLPSYIRQPLYRSDTLIPEVNGTATNNVGLDFLMWFDDLEGASQNGYSWDQISGRIKNTLGVKVSATAGAAGDWGATRALNQDDDRLKANTDYAILGATSQLPALSLSFIGPETSGRRVGMPLHWSEDQAGGFFVDMSVKYNQLPCIIVVNANNRGGILFQAADPGGAIATAATIILAELS